MPKLVRRTVTTEYELDDNEELEDLEDLDDESEDEDAEDDKPPTRAAVGGRRRPQGR